MSSLQLNNLSKTYAAFAAVKGVSLQVAAGEFISLLGPSGCGKTTILRMIAGFEKPTTGSIYLDGREITRVPANRRGMGMVFQSYSLFPHMTAAQNVAFGLRLKGWPAGKQQQRVEEMLDLVGLAEMGDRFPHQLSGGQQQRVALARALAISPQVLLLDEPLSALDAKVRLQLRNEIRRIQQQLGITTLFVTHDQEEALSISDRVVVMSQGQIDQQGTPEEIYLAPRTAFTASFIGAMNQVPGIWEQHKVRIATHPNTSLPDEYLHTLPADLPEGTAVVVLVRPESILLFPPDHAPLAGHNALSGLITSRIFLGSVVRLSVLVGEFYLNVDVPTTEAEQFSSGDLVQLSFPAEQCRVLAVDSPAASNVPLPVALPPTGVSED
ncbi:MAG TPA: ABC transporter ATP-binding protein [Synechococcales cyanobacterium M55_K2018_004]|nr:ABC transporter ATP-binding protein [Synechococcales cyanobacterium M55_K2018_004]